MSAPNKSYDPKQVSPLGAEAVDAAVAAALADIAAAEDLDALKLARLAHAGDRSPVALANREIGALPPAAKAEAGKRIGEARAKIKDALEARGTVLEDQASMRMLAEETVDVTLGIDDLPQGARHPLTAISEYVADVFVSMGWEVAEGPELEAEWFNFDALNIPADHPARSMQDTFFVGNLKGIGKVYLHAVVDSFSSYAFGFLHISKQPEAAVAVLHNDVLPFYETLDLPVKAILTDNGREFCGTDAHPYELYLDLNGIEHRRTKVKTPKTNGFVERFNGTVLDEFFRLKMRETFYESVEALQDDLDAWLEWKLAARRTALPVEARGYFHRALEQRRAGTRDEALRLARGAVDAAASGEEPAVRAVISIVSA